MRTSIFLAAMLVAVPLATAVPASASNHGPSRPCFNSDCDAVDSIYRDVQNAVDEILNAVDDALATVDQAVQDALGLLDDPLDPILRLVDCERNPDGTITCQ